MVRRYRTLRSGLTLIELVTAVFIGFLTIMTVGIVLQASQKNWVKAYNDANKGIEVDSFLAMTEFGITGRQSNRTDYYVYKLTGNRYVPATAPAGDPAMVATGDAVEFRYWDVPLSPAIMNTTRTATAYKFFYLVGTELRVDQGLYPPGAVDAGGHKRTAGVTTHTLAKNVTRVTGSTGIFNHTIKNDPDGDGSVRMNAVFTDPCDGSFITVKTATLLRNVWP